MEINGTLNVDAPSGRNLIVLILCGSRRESQGYWRVICICTGHKENDNSRLCLTNKRSKKKRKWFGQGLCDILNDGFFFFFFFKHLICIEFDVRAF